MQPEPKPDRLNMLVWLILAIAGAALSLSGVVALSLAVPEQPWEPF